MKHLRFMLAIFLMLLVVILVVQNHPAMSKEVVFRVNLLSLDYQTSEMSIYHIVTISFLFGVIISGLYGMIERFRLHKQIKELTSDSREKEKELNSLRNLPITADDVSTDAIDEDQEEAA